MDKDLKIELEKLNFNIKEKEDELKRISVITFQLNPKIQKLTKELASLKEDKRKIENKIKEN